MSAHTLDFNSYPIPRCLCGGLWVNDHCVLRNTFYGASWELNWHGRALARAMAEAFRLPQIAKWLTRRRHT